MYRNFPASESRKEASDSVGSPKKGRGGRILGSELISE